MLKGNKTQNLVIDYLESSGNNGGYQWKHDLYQIIPSSDYEFLNAIEGPDGFTYIAVCPPSDKEKAKPFIQTIMAAKENFCGIAIYKDTQWEGKAPDLTLNYGSVWAFVEYGHVAGTVKQNDEFETALKIDLDNPYDAKFDPNNDKVLIGKPSEELLPLYIRTFITEQIKAYFPQANPDFSLYEQEKLALKMSLFITLGIDKSGRELPASLVDSIIWMLPPYFPVMIS